LALDPTTGWLHLVYAYGENDDPVYYTYSTDQGDNWQPPECVGYGTNPCVVCENRLVWVSYRHYDQIHTAFRLAPGQWQAYIACGAGATTPPSMAVRHDFTSPSFDPSVYVVYGRFVPPIFYWISMSTVSFLAGVLLQEDVDGQYYPGHEPSVAVTPGGLYTPGEHVHVTYRLELEDPQTQPVLYLQRTAPGNWLVYDVTGPDALYRPPFYPSIEAFGDSVFVVWRSRAQGEDDGMIWRAEHHVEDDLPSWWYAGLLDVPTEYANCPQQSTPWAHVWHERHTYPTEDIWANLFMRPPTIPIQEDDVRSMYPNIVAEWPENGGQPLTLYTVWTSETPDPAYYVLFRRDMFHVLEEKDGGGFKGFVYYDAQVGDSVKSRYCLARDGLARWRGYSVDFGRKSLKYRLPYLNPNYDYKVMAVLFHTGRDTWEQSFAFDSAQVRKVRFAPLAPETVLMYIPREKYAKDCRADLEITKLAGDYAVLAELKLFECFPYRRKPGGEGNDGGLAGESGFGVEVLQPVPSLFRNATSVSYAVSEPQRVAVSVYDAQGRMVRRLASGFCARGKHTASWNGLDETGREVPTGAYLLRFESGGFSQTRRVVLTR